MVHINGAIQDLEQLAVFWPSRINRSDDPERASAEVQFQLPGQAVHELLAWSSRVEVTSPAFIREDILDRLRAALGRYQQVR